MRVEQFEEGDEVVVKVEIPGLDPDTDVEIQVVDEMLRIRAERHREPEVEEKGHYGSEFHYGTFSRILPLPTGAIAADVKTYKAGILEVRVLIDRNAADAKKAPSTAPDRSAIPAERAGWSGSAPTHPEEPPTGAFDCCRARRPGPMMAQGSLDGELVVLSRRECLELLRHASLGRVGVSLGALPAILPVNYGVLDDHIV